MSNTSTGPDTSIAVEHIEGQRFQARVEGQLCVADYRLGGGVMHMTHTGVPVSLEGRGIAGKLVEAAFAYAREHGYKVDPLCSYVVTYMRRHPETESLRA